MTSLLANYRIEGGKLHRKAQPPSEISILQDNERIRRMDHGGFRDLSFGGHMLRIPIEMWRDLRLKYPDLNSHDPEIRTRAWLKFDTTSEAAPFRLRDKKGKRAHAPTSYRATTNTP